MPNIFNEFYELIAIAALINIYHFKKNTLNMTSQIKQRPMQPGTLLLDCLLK